MKLGGEGTFVDDNDADVSLFGSGFELASFSSNEARGFVGFDFGLNRGGYDFSARGRSRI